MTKRLDDIATVILVVCSVAVVGMAARRQFAAPPSATGPRFVANWRELASVGHRRGQASAPVTIIEFADFQCPSCERERFSLDSVLLERPTQVSLVYRHYPLRMTHPYSDAAANAAECAGDQGKFDDFATALFDNQSQLGRRPWSALAVDAGVRDTVRFAACLGHRDFANVIDRDAAAADSINIFGTPSLIINGDLVAGAQSVDELDREIDAALKRAHK